MSPTIFKHKNTDFSSTVMKKVHIATPDGTAKFWLEPIVSLVDYYNFSTKELKEAKKIVEEKQNEFIKAWKTYFSR